MEQLPSSRYLVPECPGLGVKFPDSGFALVSILTHASVSIRSSGQGPRLPWNIFLFLLAGSDHSVAMVYGSEGWQRRQGTRGSIIMSHLLLRGAATQAGPGRVHQSVHPGVA